MQNIESTGNIATFEALVEQWQVNPDLFEDSTGISAVFARLHANIVNALYEDCLPEGFSVTSTSGGFLIIQEAFIDCVNSITSMDRPSIVQNGLDIPEIATWNNLILELKTLGIKSLLHEYLTNINLERIIHNRRLIQAFQSLDPNTQKEMIDLIPRLTVGGQIPALVCVLSPFDSKGIDVWKKFGITDENITQISDWIKMDESGVIMASPEYPSGPKSHDYVFYAMSKSATLGVSLRKQMITNTCQHEGRGHGFVDEIISHYLGHNENYTNEGFAGALGEDNRIEQTVSEDEISTFLNNPLATNDHDQYNINYRIAPVFYDRLNKLLQKKLNISKEQSWVVIIAQMINSSSTISKQTVVSAENKIRSLLHHVMSNVDISDDEVKLSIYEENGK
jgi:hypothetical protein